MFIFRQSKILTQHNHFFMIAAFILFTLLTVIATLYLFGLWRQQNVMYSTQINGLANQQYYSIFVTEIRLFLDSQHLLVDQAPNNAKQYLLNGIKFTNNLQ